MEREFGEIRAEAILDRKRQNDRGCECQCLKHRWSDMRQKGPWLVRGEGRTISYPGYDHQHIVNAKVANLDLRNDSENENKGGYCNCSPHAPFQGQSGRVGYAGTHHEGQRSATIEVII